jgi:hypothetical protein
LSFEPRPASTLEKKARDLPKDPGTEVFFKKLDVKTSPLVLFGSRTNMSSKARPVKSVRSEPNGKKPSIPKGPRVPPSNPGEAIRNLETHSNAESEPETMMSEDKPRFEFHKIKAEDRWPRSLGPRPVPGESILDVDVRPGLATSDDCGTYYLGDARKLDVNASPAALGMPSSRLGYYNTNDGTTSVVCPKCFQSFTSTQVLETGHLDPGGPCEKFRKKIGVSKRVAAKKEKVAGGNESETTVSLTKEQVDEAVLGGNHERGQGGVWVCGNITIEGL